MNAGALLRESPQGPWASPSRRGKDCDQLINVTKPANEHRANNVGYLWHPLLSHKYHYNIVKIFYSLPNTNPNRQNTVQIARTCLHTSTPLWDDRIILWRDRLPTSVCSTTGLGLASILCYCWRFMSGFIIS